MLSEYAGGGNLSQYIKSKTPLAMEVIRTYTIQILKALDFLHGNSVAHKDLRVRFVLILGDLHAVYALLICG